MLVTVKIVVNGVCKRPWCIISADEPETLEGLFQRLDGENGGDGSDSENGGDGELSYKVGKDEHSLFDCVNTTLLEVVPVYGRYAGKFCQIMSH